jgi:putative membrane protein
LFYLPRLFVYHAATTDRPGRQRFEVMEGKLYRVIMRPSMIATVALGLTLVALQPGLLTGVWLWLKLLAVVALLGYHH